MAASVAAIPHASITVEADYTAIDSAIIQLAPEWRVEHGRSLGPLPFLLSAVVGTLLEFPEANAMLDGRDLVVFDEIHLGIAVDVPGRGLVVPVVRDAHRRSVAEADVANRARTKRLSPDDVVGATYTVTNVGPFGVHDSSPIVSSPQVAILAMNSVVRRPVVVAEPDEHIEIRSIGLLTQAFDHRAFDGAYCASLLGHLARTIADTDWVVQFGATPVRPAAELLTADRRTTNPHTTNPEDPA